MPSSRGALCEPAYQRLAYPLALPLLEDGDCDFGAVPSFGIPDVAGDAHALAAGRIGRDQCLVIAVVDLGQVAEFSGVRRPCGFRNRR